MIKYFILLFVFNFSLAQSTLMINAEESNINYRIGSSGHMYSRLLEVKSYGRVDLLFLGSSHTYRGFDTRIFSKYGYELWERLRNWLN